MFKQICKKQCMQDFKWDKVTTDQLPLLWGADFHRQFFECLGDCFGLENMRIRKLAKTVFAYLEKCKMLVPKERAKKWFGIYSPW